MTCKRLIATRGLFFWILVASLWGKVAHGQDFLNLNTNVTIRPAEKINTKHLEYAPMYYGSGIVFVHAKEQDQWIDQKLGMPFFELMYAELGPDGLPGRATSFSPNIRTRFHEGPAAFTSDRKQVFFTRSNMASGQNVVGEDKRVNLKIYLADKGAEDWVNIRELPFCSDHYSVQSPTVSPDNQQIIFMSDMPGGYGGWDLYISDRYHGTWSAPRNLGPAINTTKDERMPYWHPRGVLFFSSEGHPGLGGLDIFASRIGEDFTFSMPVNLGPKFNSRKDDLSFICDAQGLSGFFASSRKESLGRDDIYHFTSDISIFKDPVLEIVPMTIAVRDSLTRAYIPGAHGWMFPIGPDGPEGISEFFTPDVSRAADGSIVIRLVPSQALDTARATLRSDALGLIGVAADPSRDHLVLVRADGYADKESILTKAMMAPGHIFTIDIVPLSARLSEPGCITGEGRVQSASTGAALSRVVVRIVSAAGATEVLETDSQGRFRMCLMSGTEYDFRLSKDRYLEVSYAHTPGVSPADRTFFLTEADLEERTGRPPVAGDVLILEHLYYDFNKSAIRTGDARELEALARMMLKYPAMTIELESHTDSRGTATYNLELSERRGMAARDFLVARGVSEGRIHLRPMGESRLRNHCKDGVECTEEEHQQNRRTEIRILTVDPSIEVRYPEEH